MKSVLLIVVGCALLAVGYWLLDGTPAFAAPAPTNFSSGFSLQPDCNPTLAPSAPGPYPQYPEGSGQTPGPCDINAFIALVKKIINYLFYISVPIATGFIIYGAFVMITSGGNPAGFQNGRKIILAAIIGFAIMLTATLLVTLVVSVLKGATQ